MLDEASKFESQQEHRRFYEKNLKAAVAKSRASLVMWLFALAAYLLDLIDSHHLIGVSLAVLYLVLINPPTLLLLKHATEPHRRGFFSVLINVLQILGYTAIIYFLGGIEAAYLTCIYAAMIAYQATVSSPRRTYLITGMCIGAYSTMILLEGTGVIPWFKVIPDFHLPWLHRLARMMVVNGLLVIVAYISTFAAKTLRDARDQLQEAHHHLERRVEERTTELAKANRQMEADITKQKMMAEELEARENQLRLIYNASPDGISLIRAADDVIVDINESFTHILGFSREEVLGQIMPHLTIWKEPGDWKYLVEKVADTNHISNLEAQLITKDEEGCVCLLSVGTLQINGQDVIQLSIRDISEIKRIQEEKDRLEEHYRQAQKVDAIGRLAGGVAHDLNNLLAPVLGYSELLLYDLAANDPSRQPVVEIEKAANRAKDLVGQLLAFSRKQSLFFKPMDLNKIVDGLLQLLRSTIRENIKIDTNLSPDISSTMADIGQIEQVIMNLVLNAQDAMPDGGRIIIETAMDELDEANAATYKDVKPGQYVKMIVSDTGCGIDQETRDQIFDPFFSTKGEQGTGLGLATVYGIVKQHNGNIWVYSEPKHGTTFKVYLPVLKTLETETPSVTLQSYDLKGSETILLVEDNEYVRNLGQTILKRYGYNPIVARNGIEALSFISSHCGQVDLLVTDVVMPEMNGKALYEKVVANCPGIKVLYMSGYTDDIISHHGVLDQGVHFIQKPFSVNKLLTKIRELLN